MEIEAYANQCEWTWNDKAIELIEWLVKNHFLISYHIKTVGNKILISRTME